VSAPLDGGITATEAGAESVTVRLGRVRVRIPAGLLTTGAPAVPGSAVSVRLPALRPALSPGFLVVSGSRGSGPPDTPCLRVYFHIDTPDAAPTVWGAILVRLEELGVTYRAKVVSARQLYPRRDAMVVYLRAPSWAAVPAIQHAAKATGALGTDVSAYVAHIDSGVGWAWDPEDPRPGMGGMSFGEHRSHAIATGILAAATGNGTGDREAAVGAALCAAGIRPGEIHRNIDSPDWSEISSLNDAEGR